MSGYVWYAKFGMPFILIVLQCNFEQTYNNNLWRDIYWRKMTFILNFF